MSDSEDESEDPPVPPRSRNTKKKQKIPGEVSDSELLDDPPAPDVEPEDPPVAPRSRTTKKLMIYSDDDTDTEMQMVLDQDQDPYRDRESPVSDSLLDRSA